MLIPCGQLVAHGPGAAAALLLHVRCAAHPPGNLHGSSCSIVQVTADVMPLLCQRSGAVAQR